MAHTVLKSNSSKDPFGKRLYAQVQQLERFLDTHLDEGEMIDQLLFEGVRSSHVLTTVGAFCIAKQLQGCKFSPKACFVGALRWKAWARKNGATSQKFKEIKGVTALREVGFDVDAYGIESEDAADSCLIFLCWASTHG